MNALKFVAVTNYKWSLTINLIMRYIQTPNLRLF